MLTPQPARRARSGFPGRVGVAGGWGGRGAEVVSRHYRRHGSRSRPLALARGRQSRRDCRPRAVGRRILAWPSRPPRTVRPRQGALVYLQFALSFLAIPDLLAGELTTAARLIDEDDLIAE